jgi:hypothetical protein
MPQQIMTHPNSDGELYYCLSVFEIVFLSLLEKHLKDRNQ